MGEEKQMLKEALTSRNDRKVSRVKETKRGAIVLAFVMLFVFLEIAFARSFKVYPGAKLEDF